VKILIPAIAAILVWSAPSSAQVFGQYTGADPLEPNQRSFGAYVHSSDNESGLLAQLRLSFYPGVDFGFQGGLVRRTVSLGDRTTLRLGGDLKIRVAQQGPDHPLAIAFGAALGVETGDQVNVVSLTPTVTVSRSFHASQNAALIPYARAGLGFSKLSIGDFSDSDFSLPLRFGSELRLSASLGIVAEIQVSVGDRLNDNLGLVGGVNLPF
jgi:hypothetical protein